MKTNKKFIFAAYLAPPPAITQNNFDYDICEKGYRYLAEALFDYAYGYYEKAPTMINDVLRSLDLAEKYGIGYLVQDENLSKKEFNKEAFIESAKAYTCKKAYVGNFVFDEPGMCQIARAADMSQFYSQQYPNKLAYINLQPIDSPPHYLLNGMWTAEQAVKGVTYFEYLEEYITAAQPKFLSYDFYPFTQNAGETKGEYFLQLSQISRVAKAHKIPFWAYVQACTWDESAARAPTSSELYWNVFTCIAYGAVAIQYFCFFTPYSSKDSGAAMITSFGERTNRYYAAKECHVFLRNVQSAICGKRHDGIIVSGNSLAAIPKIDVITLSAVKAVEGDVIIGVFEGKYLLAVANRIDEGVQSISIQFKNSQIVKVTLMDGKSSSYLTDCVKLEMVGGGAALVEIG